MEFSRCPRGTRRNRLTGLCESCPIGTIRVRNKCVPAPLAPLAPLAPANQQYVVPLFKKRNANGRCPRTFKVGNFPTYCEKCPPNTTRHRSGLCQSQINPIIVPHPLFSRCPAGSMRNKTTGNCQTCPNGTRKRGNKCIPISPQPNDPIFAQYVPPVLPMPQYVPPVLPMPAASDPTPSNAQEIQFVSFLINATNQLLPIAAANPILNNAAVLQIRDILIHLKHNLSRDWSQVRMTKIIIKNLLTYSIVLNNLGNRTNDLNDPIENIYVIFFKLLLPKIIHLSSNDVNDILKKFKPLPNSIVTSLQRLEDRETINNILELFEEFAIMYDARGNLSLKPVAFIKTNDVDIKSTEIVPPLKMFDLEEGGDVDFNPNMPDRICVIIRDGMHINASSLDMHRLIKAINPRTPEYLFMACKKSIHGWNINDDTVYKDLYVSLSKVGLSQTAYVNINEIKSALNTGNNCIVIEPKMIAGVRYVTPIASASLYKAPGQNVVGRFHCEAGHLGGIYNVFLPVLVEFF